MGVYIKGMDMPHNCVECKLPYEICGYSCRTDIRLRHERHENCPLVGVKAPHGRLIDADALIKSVEADAIWEDDIANEYDNGIRAGARATMRSIRNAPAIIEAEG